MIHVRTELEGVPGRTVDPSPDDPRPQADQWAPGLGVPASSDAFIGRRRELAELGDLLAQQRLTVLTGPSGVGKTRLARELAAGCGAERFPDGIRLVELARLEDPGLVAGAIAAAFAVWEHPGQPILVTLASRLRERDVLLIMDNCEHLLEACADTARTLLELCPNLTIVATSQAPLAVAGERVWPVPALPVPQGDGNEEPGTSEAVSLFLARAAAVRPGFEATVEGLAVVGEICRQLGGIPLAIELAAARVAVLSLPELAARLDSRLSVLTGGSRVVPRHQTLRAAVDWSHDLLADHEKVLLRRMSVFAGGCSAAAAAAVCGEDGDYSLLPVLTGLTERSLVIQQTSSGQPRYALLETIRIYGAERLEAAGEERTLRSRHARWALALAEEAEPYLTGEDQSAWLNRLATEHDNLRAALTWMLAAGEVEPALRLAGALTLFWRVRGHFHEGRTWLDTALSRAAGAADQIRAVALWGAGFLALMLGDDDAAVSRLEESLELARALSDRRLEARDLLLLGNRLMFRDPEPAAALLGAAAEMARDAGDVWCLAHALALGGRTQMGLGNAPTAQRLLDECLVVARKGHNQQSLKMGLLVAGDAALTLGEYDQAESLLTEALATAQELEEPYTVASAMGHLGDLATLRGRYDEARPRLTQALTIARDSGNPALVADVLASLGWLAHAQVDIEAARVHFSEAMAVCEEIQRPFPTVLRGMAEVLRATGDPAAARALFDQALALVERVPNDRGRAAVLAGLANVAGDRHDLRGARSRHRLALKLWLDLGPVAGLADELEDVAGLAVADGDPDRAARLFAAATKLREARGYVRSPFQEAAHAEDLAGARTGLDRDAFDAAWAAGKDLSPQDAVALANEPPRPGAGIPDGWGGLTPAQREIAALVVQGHTNREIGLRLALSPRTVETHLTHAFARLGIGSRRELVLKAGGAD